MSESPMSRFSLASVLVLVGVVAAELAAMRAATDPVTRWALALTLLALGVGLLGAIVRRGGGWIGFALFGWSYAGLALIPAVGAVAGPLLPVEEPLQLLAERLHPVPSMPEQPSLNLQFLGRIDGMTPLEAYTTRQWTREMLSKGEIEAMDRYVAEFDRFKAGQFDANQRQFNASRIGQMALCLLAGLVGAAFGLFLERRPAPGATRADHELRGVGHAHQPTVGGPHPLARG